MPFCSSLTTLPPTPETELLFDPENDPIFPLRHSVTQRHQRSQPRWSPHLAFRKRPSTILQQTHTHHYSNHSKCHVVSLWSWTGRNFHMWQGNGTSPESFQQNWMTTSKINHSLWQFNFRRSIQWNHHSTKNQVDGHAIPFAFLYRITRPVQIFLSYRIRKSWRLHHQEPPSHLPPLSVKKKTSFTLPNKFDSNSVNCSLDSRQGCVNMV